MDPPFGSQIDMEADIITAQAPFRRRGSALVFMQIKTLRTQKDSDIHIEQAHAFATMMRILARNEHESQLATPARLFSEEVQGRSSASGEQSGPGLTS